MSYGEQFFGPGALPAMGYRSVDFIHPVTQAKVMMSDCMDYSILIKMLYDLAGPPNNYFHVEELKARLEKLGYRMHPGLEDFLREYPEPSKINELKAHRRWAELISALDGVKYVRDGYEIDTQVSNALKVYEHLLFQPIGEGHPIAPEHRFDTLGSRSKQLDLVCSVLSRDQREVDWNLKGSRSKKDLDDPKKESDLELEPSLEGWPSYTWEISRDHSTVSPLEQEEEHWKNGLGSEMAKQMINHHLLSQPRIRQSLVWLLGHSQQENRKVLDHLGYAREENEYQDLVRSIPLETSDNKLFVIQELLVPHQHPGSYQFVKNLIKALPRDDFHTQMSIFNSLLRVQPVPDDLQEDLENFLFLVTQDVNKTAKTAAALSYVEILKFLAEHAPASLSQADGSGNTPAHEAALNGHAGVLKFLAKNAPRSLKIRPKGGGGSALDRARRWFSCSLLPCLGSKFTRTSCQLFSNKP